jgi:uncharacterized protein YggE
MKQKFQILSAVMLVLLLGAMPLQFSTDQVAAQTPSTDQQTQSTISVSGTGQVSAQPDTAVVTIGVETQAAEAGATMSQNSQQMTAVVNALEKAGVAAKDIQTQVVQLQPVYEQPQPGQTVPITGTKLVGYIATNLVQVRTQQLDTLGQLLDTAVQAGANRIESISFEVSDSSALMDQARQAAWQDAQHKASQLAELAGVQLGSVLSITESSQPPTPIFEQAASPAGAVPIQPGTQTVRVDLQVTWALK